MTDTALFRKLIADIEFKERLIELTGSELGKLKADLAALLNTSSRDALSFPIAAEGIANPPQPNPPAQKETEPTVCRACHKTMSDSIRKRMGTFEPNLSLDPDDLPGELWRLIPQSNGYELSNKGRVRRLSFLMSDNRTRKIRILKQYPDRGGWKLTIRRPGGTPITYSTHIGIKQIWEDGA